MGEVMKFSCWRAWGPQGNSPAHQFRSALRQLRELIGAAVPLAGAVACLLFNKSTNSTIPSIAACFGASNWLELLMLIDEKKQASPAAAATQQSTLFINPSIHQWLMKLIGIDWEEKLNCCLLRSCCPIRQMKSNQSINQSNQSNKLKLF